jgi:CheY-like chemotaxis protein
MASLALQRAAQARPDIVLLDAMMPGMDGFEVARRLKADAATAHIPIIFMTGLTETEHLVAALEAGGVDYVTKPIRPQGSAGAHGRAPAGRARGRALSQPGAQRARRLRLRQHHRARARRPPDVADPAGA